MNHMIIKDMLTGHAHEYGTNPHDSLIVSEDGRSLAYYNLQNGDGSRFGDYRFVGDDQEGYWNIGGVSIFVPERKTEWIPCSERLPEEGREVLACLTDWKTGGQRRVVSYRMDFNMWHGYGRYNEKCVAWMPLPEPWKEGDAE